MNLIRVFRSKSNKSKGKFAFSVASVGCFSALRPGSLGLTLGDFNSNMNHRETVGVVYTKDPEGHEVTRVSSLSWQDGINPKEWTLIGIGWCHDGICAPENHLAEAMLPVYCPTVHAALPSALCLSLMHRSGCVTFGNNHSGPAGHTDNEKVIYRVATNACKKMTDAARSNSAFFRAIERVIPSNIPGIAIVGSERPMVQAVATLQGFRNIACAMIDANRFQMAEQPGIASRLISRIPDINVAPIIEYVAMHDADDWTINGLGSTEWVASMAMMGPWWVAPEGRCLDQTPISSVQRYQKGGHGAIAARYTFPEQVPRSAVEGLKDCLNKLRQRKNLIQAIHGSHRAITDELRGEYSSWSAAEAKRYAKLVSQLTGELSIPFVTQNLSRHLINIRAALIRDELDQSQPTQAQQ